MPTDCTLAEYARSWLRIVRLTRKLSTARRYEQILRRYVVPAIGELHVSQVSRAACAGVITSLLESGRAKATARAVLAVMQALLTAACVDDELIEANPALGLGRRLRIVVPRRAQKEQIRALTMGELRRFLEQAWLAQPKLAPLFEVYARAGLRLGEGLALKWSDVSEDSIRVSRTYSDRRLSVPKSGYARTVEIGQRLWEILGQVPHQSSWCFVSSRTRGLWDATHIGRTCKKIGRALDMQGVHPHILRHTYASLLLAQGEPPEWVSRQLGHASLDLTIVCYGRWIQAKNPSGLRYFDQMVSAGEFRPRIKRRTGATVRLIPGGRV